MGLQFEGAIDNITERQIDFIREVLEKRGFKDLTVKIEPVGHVGDNYIANVKRIIAKDGNEEFRMVAKIAPQLEVVRLSTQSEKLFRNEHIIYTKVLPKFQQLEEEADIPKRDRLRFAECYGSLSEAPNEVILLEDLQVPGFKLLDRFQPLPDECVKSVLKNFAILHSLSFALKHRHLDTFKEFSSELFDMWSSMDGEVARGPYFVQIENTAAMLVEGDDRKKRFKGCIVKSLAESAKLVQQDAGSKHTVIKQGDSWTNNILFRYDEETLEQSVMIDYQVSKESNPSYDVMYMIFNCTDHKSRLHHYHEWIDYYHSELDRALTNHNLKASHVYPKDQLEADMRRYAKLLFGVSVILSSVSLLKPDDAAKLKEAMEKPAEENEAYEGNKQSQDFVLLFKKRMEDLVDSFIEFGLM